LTTAATATRFASGVISPEPGVHARTDGRTGPEDVPDDGVPDEEVPVGSVPGVPGEEVPDGSVPGIPDEEVPDGLPGVPGGAEEVFPDPLQPTSSPAPAISSPRRPNSPEETMLAVSPASQTRYWVTR
jgi:hypothetical protein